LINNRQQGGRRRGRGGQRGQNLGSGGSGGGGGQPGNRQDNRQRGNAAQLLEKYKSLARDAQLAGDRVQTEYYLQYADHYFRVLGESRSRFEEQRRQRGDGSDEDEGEDDLVEADGETSESDERQERPQRQDRGERYSPREPRETREPRHYARDNRGGNDDGDEDMDRPAQRASSDDDSLPLDVLPPAIGADGPTSLAIDEVPEPEPAPRRTRAPRRPKTGDGVAPAA
jgi:hypothetical protein